MLTAYLTGAEKEQQFHRFLCWYHGREEFARESITMICFSVNHLLQVTGMLIEEGEEHRCARGQLRFVQVRRPDGLATLAAGAIKLTKMLNQSAVILPRDSLLKFLVSACFNYARPSETLYGESLWT